MTMIPVEGALKRLVLPARAAAMAVLFVCALAAALSLINPYLTDFIAYWAAGVLALDGNPAGAYDPALHHATGERAIPIDGALPFAYPPFALLLFAPFALLPYGMAAALWMAATLAGFWVAARRLLGGAAVLALAFPPVAVNAIAGQNGFLTAGLLLGGLALMSRSPLVAGLLLGSLVLKPHLAIMVPLALAAGGQWRVLAWAGVAALAWIAAGLAAFGASAHAAWIAQAPLFASIAAEGLTGWHKMASVYAALRVAGLGQEAAMLAHCAAALAAGAAVVLIWRRSECLGTRIAALSVASALASPYLYVYDTVLLAVPLLWLAATERNPVGIVTLWSLPLLSVAQNWGLRELPNLFPLVPLAMLILIAWRMPDAFRPGASRRIIAPAAA